MCGWRGVGVRMEGGRCARGGGVGVWVEGGRCARGGGVRCVGGGG